MTVDEQAYNALHGTLRCLGERANSLLKTSYKALRRYRGCPWRIGDITAAALVMLHHEHHHTTWQTKVNHTKPPEVTRKGSLINNAGHTDHGIDPRSW